MRDTLHKAGSKTNLKTVSMAHSEKKVFVKKELTHHVVIKNEKLLLQAISPPDDGGIVSVNNFGITILPTGHNSTKNANTKSLSRDPT